MGKQKSLETKRKMSESGRRAWQTKRKKAVIGEERLIDNRVWIRIKSKKGWLYWVLKEGQPKLSPGRKGKLNPFYGKKHSSDAIEILKRKATGRKASDETRKKMSLVRKGKTKNAEWKRKISESRRKYPFDKRSKDKIAKARIRKSAIYREWRKAIFERDNYICQFCRAKSKKGERVYIEAHHIKSYTRFPALRFDIDNGITACRKCHKIISKFQMMGNKNAHR